MQASELDLVVAAAGVAVVVVDTGARALLAEPVAVDDDDDIETGTEAGVIEEDKCGILDAAGTAPALST